MNRYLSRTFGAGLATVIGSRGDCGCWWLLVAVDAACASAGILPPLAAIARAAVNRAGPALLAPAGNYGLGTWTSKKSVPACGEKPGGCDENIDAAFQKQTSRTVGRLTDTSTQDVSLLEEGFFPSASNSMCS